jgi:hypothetical protein
MRFIIKELFVSFLILRLFLIENSNFLDLLTEVPYNIGPGIDFSTKSIGNNQKEKQNKPNLVDLSKAILQVPSSANDSFLSNQSFGQEDSASLASLSFQQNEADFTVSEILINNEYTEAANEASELWNKKSVSRSSSDSSSSLNIDELLSKRKIKKYAIEADQKLIKSFEEIKSNLAHQVRY